MNGQIAFLRVTTAPSVRTPVVVPAGCKACSYVWMESEDAINATRVWLTASGGTYRTLQGGAIREVVPSNPLHSHTVAHAPRRWVEGETVCYLEAMLGTGPVLVGFIQ